jgi:hypothetical protein
VSNVAISSRRLSPPDSESTANGRERGVRRRQIRIVLPLPEGQVRVTADQRRLEHRGGEGVLGQLRQQGKPPGPLAVAPFTDLATVEHHAARGRTAKARERMQRQRLADAIAPEHGDELAAHGGKLEALHERSPGNGDVDGTAGERGRSGGVQGCRRS